MKKALIQLRHKRLTKLGALAAMSCLAIGLAGIVYWQRNHGNTSKDPLIIARQAVADKQYLKAEEVYLSLIKSGKGSNSTIQELAFTYQLDNKKTEAIKQYENIKESSTDASVFNNLGNLYRDAGDYTKSIAAYQKAVTINPNFQLAVINLSHLYTLQGENQKAIDLLESHYKSNRQTADIGIKLASLYSNTGENEKARATLTEILQANTEDANAKKMLEIIDAKL